MSYKIVPLRPQKFFFVCLFFAIRDLNYICTDICKAAQDKLNEIKLNYQAFSLKASYLPNFHFYSPSIHLFISSSILPTTHPSIYQVAIMNTLTGGTALNQLIHQDFSLSVAVIPGYGECSYSRIVFVATAGDDLTPVQFSAQHQVSLPPLPGTL